MSEYNPVDIYNAMRKRLTYDDLRTVCFYLEHGDPPLERIDFNSLPADKSQGIVDYCETYNAIDTLVEVLQKYYPHVLRGVAKQGQHLIPNAQPSVRVHERNSVATSDSSSTITPSVLTPPISPSEGCWTKANVIVAIVIGLVLIAIAILAWRFPVQLSGEPAPTPTAVAVEASPQLFTNTNSTTLTAQTNPPNSNKGSDQPPSFIFIAPGIVIFVFVVCVLSLIFVCLFFVRKRNIELHRTQIKIGPIEASTEGCVAIVATFVIAATFGVILANNVGHPTTLVITALTATYTPAPIVVMIAPGLTATDNGTGIYPTPTPLVAILLPKSTATGSGADMHPTPTIDNCQCGGSVGDTLVSVSMVSATEGWSVSSLGGFFHFANGTWTQLKSASERYINSIFMVSKDEGWAVGFAGLILHYADGNWIEMASPTRVNLHSVYMISKDEGWATGDNGIILHYKSGKWLVEIERISNGPQYWDTKSLSTIYMLSANEGWAAGDALVHYKDGRWSLVNSPISSIRNIYMVSANEGWAVAPDYEGKTTILHYVDGRWQLYGYVEGNLYSVFMTSGDEGWAVGDIIMHYIHGGWINVGIPGNVALLYSVYMVSPLEGWAVGNSKTKDKYSILHYQNCTWSEYQQ